jgi:ATP-dependent Zn protease
MMQIIIIVVIVAVIGLAIFFSMTKQQGYRKSNDRERRQKNFERLMETLKTVRENEDKAGDDNKTEESK